MRLRVKLTRLSINPVVLALTSACLLAQSQNPTSQLESPGAVASPQSQSPPVPAPLPPLPPPPPPAPVPPPSAAAQTPLAAADAELPGAIFKDAMHPLDVVRQSIDNWSDSELAALSIGIHMAHDACDKMNPDDYSGDNLYDLAHLCAFGQDWNPANTAAQRYLRSMAPEHRAQSYAISIGAYVHINALDLAISTAREMLRSMPYDAEVAYSVRYMKDDLEIAGSPVALQLATEEHDEIIAALSKGIPLKAVYDDAVVNIGALYAMAMEAAFFERYAGHDAQAEKIASDVEKALPEVAALTAEDREEIDSAELQYQLLGTKLKPIPVIRSFKSSTIKAKIGDDFGEATVLVVFPDWCAQCKKMMPTMTRFGFVNSKTPLHAYGLLFLQAGETEMPSTQKELLGTDVMQISESTADRFGSSDYPLGIVVDREGIIRFIGVLPADAFNDDGYLEKVIMRMIGAPSVSRAPTRSQHAE